MPQCPLHFPANMGQKVGGGGERGREINMCITHTSSDPIEYEASNRKPFQFCIQCSFSPTLLPMTEALVHKLFVKALHTEPVLINLHLLSSLQADILCLEGIHFMCHFSGHNWQWTM